MQYRGQRATIQATEEEVECAKVSTKLLLRFDNTELGDRMFSEMRDALLKPNVETYKQLIALHLTQPEYEDAFFYLEEMKAAGFKPPYSSYDGIVRKCVAMGDSRYKLAVEELEQMGYAMTPDLIAFVDSGGSSSKSTSGSRSQ